MCTKIDGMEKMDVWTFLKIEFSDLSPHYIHPEILFKQKKQKTKNKTMLIAMSMLQTFKVFTLALKDFKLGHNNP